MRKSDKILRALIYDVRKIGHEVIIPNFYFGNWEMDLFRLLNTGYLTEYEVKTSRGDFRNDFKKSTEDVKYNFAEKKIEKSNFRTKHEMMEAGNYIANKFFFVVPENLIKPDEVPDYAGLIYFDEKYNVFKTIKPAKFIHKNKPDIDFKQICKSLCYREYNQRLKNLNLTNQIKNLRK
jgi:hypothetical protein